MDKTSKEFCKELKILLEKYNVNLGVDIDGDTFGITVNGFMVFDNKTGNKTCLSKYSLYLNAYDLKLALQA